MTNKRLYYRAGVSLGALILSTGTIAQSSIPPAEAAQAPATAAQEPASDEAIIITGSRIRRDPLSQDSPVTFVDRADIDKTGLNSINDVLQRLPSAGGGLNGKFNN